MASFPGQQGTGGAPLPNAVVSLMATEQSATSVQLSWPPVSNAISYNVYRGGALLTNTTINPYLDSTCAPATAYVYAVQGVNLSGVGVPSPPAAVTTPPGQVMGLTANAVSSSEIDLSWTATAGASTYTVDRGGVPIATPSGTTYADTGLSPSTTYTYQVAANGVGGQGAFSASASATTQTATVGQYKVPAGHFAQTSNFHGDAGAFTAATSFYNSNVKPNVNVKGMQKYTYPADIDAGTVAGSPNFGTLTTGGLGRWKTLLDTCAADGKYLIMGIYEHGFTASTGTIPSNGGGVVPQYFVGANWAACGASGDVWPVGIALWETTGGVVGWWKALIDAYSVLDGHPALAAFNIPWVESTTNTAGANRGGKGPNFSGANLYANALAVITYARQKMPHTLIKVGLNFCSDSTPTSAMASFMQSLKALGGIILGSTDPEGSVNATYPTPGFTKFITANEVFRGHSSNDPTSPVTFPDLRGQMFFGSESQQIGWSYSGHTSSTTTPTQLFAQNQGVMGATDCLQCWQVENGALNSYQTWSGGILPFINSIAGGINKTAPTDLPPGSYTFV